MVSHTCRVVLPCLLLLPAATGAPVAQTPRPPAVAVSAAATPATAAREQARKDVEALVHACNRFGNELYRQLREQGNPTSSAGSIALALHMLLVGADGETAAEIRKVLALPDELQGERLHAAVESLLATTTNAIGANLRIVDDLWVAEGHRLLPAFEQVLGEHFGAAPRRVDFEHPLAARDTINTYVAKVTEDRIRDLLPADAITPLTRVVLTNALWFQGAWTHHFLEGGTEPRAFTLADGARVEVPTMQVTDSFAHAATEHWTWIALPFANSTLQFEIAVPTDAGTLERAEADLLAGDCIATELVNRRRVALRLPRFSVSGEHDLIETLRALGMNAAFGRTADFSKLDGTHDLYVSQAVHRTWLRVDEVGAEAAAATAVVMKWRGIEHGEAVAMHVDRPFAFTLRDRKTGMRWFAGRVTDPRQN